ncbi:DoxX family membrane protein [Streptomyces sp. NBRC 110028]|uniref:DoxX family membrane protein n=1 Tax=Streptomyces sp. NBRC 110028 TaxID=1621260 RepID=UPI00351CB014
METRKFRTPLAGRAPGFDDEPQLTMAKVPCDPAKVAVNPPSFRVHLASPVVSSALADTARHAGIGTGAVPRRRPPVVWSGRTRPGGDTAATRLLQAVRYSETVDGPEDVGTTQVLPRVTFDDGPPTVIGPRSPRRDPAPENGRPPRPGETGRPPRPRESDATHRTGPTPRVPRPHAAQPTRRMPQPAHRTPHPHRTPQVPRPRRPSDQVRHAYYPDRRMNLGVVLLPLRVFLGFISVYAGMGKLSDPVYFDGGERGSMVTWLRSLHPWPIAEPLRDLALEHPVGAGLTVAFLQIVVGVLTILGLWQRLAACVGAVLSAALILTVSWRTVPVYDAPDIIYLAAWSPLIIAGAPVYSADARLAGEAWRRLGPRVELWALRRRVLRRGTVMAMVVAGLTLLLGSMIGGAVRSSETVRAPEPREVPRNSLPGSPLPRKPETSPRGGVGGAVDTPGTPSHRAPLGRTTPSASPSASATSGSPSATGPASGSGSPGQARRGHRTAPRTPNRPAAPMTTPGGPDLDGTGAAGLGGTSSEGGGLGGGAPAAGSYDEGEPAQEEAALGGLLG